MNKKMFFLGILVLLLAGSTGYLFTQNSKLKEEIKVEKQKDPEQAVIRVPEKVEKNDASKREVVTEVPKEQSVEKTNGSSVESDTSNKVEDQAVIESKQEVLAFMDSFVQNYFVVDDVTTYNDYLKSNASEKLYEALVLPDDYLLTVTQESIVEDQTFYVDFVDNTNVRVAGVIDLSIGNVPQSMFGSFVLVKQESNWVVDSCSFESITSSTEGN